MMKHRLLFTTELASTTQNKLLSFKDIVHNIHFNNLETFGTKL